MTPTPYLNTPAAKAVARRLERKGLLNPNWWVQYLPVCLPDAEDIHYVLRYYAAEDAEEPISQVHFMAGKKGGKSAAVIEQLAQELKWRWGDFKPNFLLVRKLATTANTRLFKLKLLLEPA